MGRGVGQLFDLYILLTEFSRSWLLCIILLGLLGARRGGDGLISSDDSISN